MDARASGARTIAFIGEASASSSARSHSTLASRAEPSRPRGMSAANLKTPATEVFRTTPASSSASPSIVVEFADAGFVALASMRHVTFSSVEATRP
jgi:hypothetical protein